VRVRRSSLSLALLLALTVAVLPPVATPAGRRSEHGKRPGPYCTGARDPAQHRAMLSRVTMVASLMMCSHVAVALRGPRRGTISIIWMLQ
jgi:hypothetical protein